MKSIKHLEPIGLSRLMFRRKCLIPGLSIFAALVVLSGCGHIPKVNKVITEDLQSVKAAHGLEVAYQEFALDEHGTSPKFQQFKETNYLARYMASCGCTQSAQRQTWIDSGYAYSVLGVSSIGGLPVLALAAFMNDYQSGRQIQPHQVVLVSTAAAVALGSSIHWLIWRGPRNRQENFKAFNDCLREKL